MMRKAVFIDRDGTINVDTDFVHKKDEWEWIEGAKEAIKKLNDAGFVVVVVTNQSGIARGRYTEDDVQTLHSFVDAELAKISAHVDGYYLCPHHPEHGNHRECDCRKPATGMLLKAAKEHNIDLARSFLIGDKKSDIEAAVNAGVTPVLVMTGYGKEHDNLIDKNVHREDNLREVVDWIAGNL